MYRQNNSELCSNQLFNSYNASPWAYVRLVDDDGDDDQYEFEYVECDEHDELCGGDNYGCDEILDLLRAPISVPGISRWRPSISR